jgi:hypothetical protein
MQSAVGQHIPCACRAGKSPLLSCNCCFLLSWLVTMHQARCQLATVQTHSHGSWLGNQRARFPSDCRSSRGSIRYGTASMMESISSTRDSSALTWCAGVAEVQAYGRHMAGIQDL